MPDVEIRFHPETKSQAKGRNGYFQPSLCALYDFEVHERRNGWRYDIEIRSQRSGDHAPIVLNLTTEDARLLRDGLDRLLRKGTARLRHCGTRKTTKE
jgi:hypothetical protein